MNFSAWLCKWGLKMLFKIVYICFYNRLEATYCGCFPLVPNRLVYPEIYPESCIYNDCDDLFERLKTYCLEPSTAINARENLQIDLEKYSSCNLLPQYINIFTGNANKVDVF